MSAVIQKKLPSKCKDPGMFSLPIMIGNVKIEHAMCDLGASINVMPLSVYNNLTGVELVETRVVIQLADRSCICPEGVLENVLVKVHDFLYPADFYVIKMSDMVSKDSSGVLLGRPFLRTAKTIINVFDGTICLDYHGEKFTFSIDDAMKAPLDVENVYAIDVIDPLVQEYLETDLLQDGYEHFSTEYADLEARGMSELFNSQGLTDEEIEAAILTLCKKPEFTGFAGNVDLPGDNPVDRPLPSEIHSPELELKPLPPNLKYVYLENKETLPVIINGELTPNQEEQLICLLKKRKKAIGTLADITGISPNVCMHYILLESDAKPYRDPPECKPWRPPWLSSKKKLFSPRRAR